MPQYRFSPTRAGRHWWAIFGVAIVLLAIPALLNLVVPERQNPTDQVRLGQFGYDWEIPLDHPDGSPVTCHQSTEALGGHLWDCEGTIVQAMITQGSTDEEHTLERMMRMTLLDYPPDDIPTFREGEALLKIDDRFGAVGMSLPGTGDQEGASMIAIIYGGTAVPELADAVWYSFSDGHPLPQPVLFLLEGMSHPPIPETGTPRLEELTETA